MPIFEYHDDPRINLRVKTHERLSRLSIIAPIAPVYRKASRHSGQETQMLYGHHFDVYKLSRGWAWGQTRSPVRNSKIKGYIGYVPAKYLEESNSRASHVITALKAPVFVTPDIKSRIMKTLPMGSHVKGQGRNPNFVQLEAGGYIHRKHLRKRAEPSEVKDFVTIAESHMGLPYVWGGISSDGLDCSGLVLSSLRSIGQDALRDADMMEARLGYELPLSQRGLKRGDLIFWKGHVGIMQSATGMIHANAFHMRVESEKLIDAIARIQQSGGGHITAIKRL